MNERWNNFIDNIMFEDIYKRISDSRLLKGWIVYVHRYLYKDDARPSGILPFGDGVDAPIEIFKAASPRISMSYKN